MIANIREQLELLFNDSTIRAITEKAHAYDLAQLVKAKIGTNYAAKMMHQAEINFIQYLVSPVKYKSAVTQVNTEYEVIINYIKEVDLNGDNYHAVTDFYETFYTRLVAVLGDKWNDTIVGYQLQQTAPIISLDFLHDKNVWVSNFEISIIA